MENSVVNLQSMLFDIKGKASKSALIDIINPVFKDVIDLKDYTLLFNLNNAYTLNINNPTFEKAVTTTSNV